MTADTTASIASSTTDRAESQDVLDPTITLDPRAPLRDESEIPATGITTAEGTAMVDDQIAALVAAIAALHPEARAEATRRGILATAPRPAAERTIRSTTRAPKAAPATRQCACGCGQTTKSTWAAGHDGVTKGKLLRLLRGSQLATEIGWEPNAEIKTIIATNPAWGFAAELVTG